MKKQTEINDQAWLLLMLVFFLILPIPAVLAPLAFQAIFPLTYSLLMLCGIRAVSDRRRHYLIILTLGIPGFALIWLTFFNDSSHHLLAAAKTIVLLAFFSYLAFRLYVKIGSNKEVSLEIILGSISGYLLLGLIGGLLYQGLELMIPGSFNLDNPIYNLFDLNYFSFVTLTTLGFGDIVPQNQAAKSLVVLLSISGQLYLTILVAMLVGKYLSQARQWTDL